MKSPHNPYHLVTMTMPLAGLRPHLDPRAGALCMFGCRWFGRKPTCPPRAGEFSLAAYLDEYRWVWLAARRYPFSDGNFAAYWRRFSTNEIHELVLRKERALFHQGHAYAKAFIGGSCKACADDACPPGRCRVPGRGRMPLEATGLDVLSLMKQVKLDYQNPPKQYFWRVGAVLW